LAGARVTSGDADVVGDGETDSTAALTDGEGDADVLGSADGEGSTDGAGSGDAEALAEGSGEAVDEGVGLSTAVGVGVGVESSAAAAAVQPNCTTIIKLANVVENNCFLLILSCLSPFNGLIVAYKYIY